MKKLINYVFLILICSSCSVRMLDFTVISSKNHNLNIDRSKGVRVTGKSNGLFGLGTSIKDAMDNALNNAGSEYDLLLDGVIRINDYYLIKGFTVEGTAIKSSELRASLGVYYEDWCKVNKVNYKSKH